MKQQLMLPSKSFASRDYLQKALIRKHCKGASTSDYTNFQRSHIKKELSLSRVSSELDIEFLKQMPRVEDTIMPNGPKGTLRIREGLWMLSIPYIKKKQDRDFTIAVLSGQSDGVPLFRFDPESIEEDMVSKHGRIVYDDWKKRVLDDLPSLVSIVQKAKKLIREPVSSVTCCERSAKLCRRVGIDVIDNFAFLMPSGL